MLTRRHAVATACGGMLAAIVAKTGLAEAGTLREMQFMQPDAGPPAPAPNTPGFGNGGMAPNGATQPGEAGPYRRPMASDAARPVRHPRRMRRNRHAHRRWRSHM